jgi:hypothetical protein
VNQHGYRVNEEGHVIDKSGNVILDKSALLSDGQLPPLFKNKAIIGAQSDDEISNLLDQIEGELNHSRNRGK